MRLSDEEFKATVANIHTLQDQKRAIDAAKRIILVKIPLSFNTGWTAKSADEATVEITKKQLHRYARKMFALYTISLLYDDIGHELRQEMNKVTAHHEAVTKGDQDAMA